MNTEQLKTAHNLLQQIEKNERLLLVYREAPEVIVGRRLKGQGAFPQLSDEITLTGAEIADQIVTVLERRIAASRKELQQLGVA